MNKYTLAQIALALGIPASRIKSWKKYIKYSSELTLQDAVEIALFAAMVGFGLNRNKAAAGIAEYRKDNIADMSPQTAMAYSMRKLERFASLDIDMMINIDRITNRVTSALA